MIDDIVYFQDNHDEPKKIILLIKSGKVSSRDVKDLQ